MTGAWRGGLQLSSPTSLAPQTASSLGVAVAGGSSTFTKGSWVQIVASTTADSACLMLYLQQQTGASSSIAVDIGFGGSGSEQVVLANACAPTMPSEQAYWYSFPIAIPAGTRIAARSAGSTASDVMTVGIITLADTFLSSGAGSAVDTYGFNTGSNIGVSIDPGGTANTKGAYTTLTSSLTADIAGFMILFDYQNNITGNAGGVTFLVDVSVGAAASEVVLIPNLFLSGLGSGGFCGIYGALPPYFPLQVRAGSRIAVRAQCSVTTTPDRVLGATLYAVRQ